MGFIVVESCTVSLRVNRWEAIKGKHGYELAVDKTLDEVDPEVYAILVLPGGVAPAVVRKEPKALEIARNFFHGINPLQLSVTGRRS